MPQSDGYFNLLQKQMEQILDDIRSQRQDIAEVKSHMVSKDDLKANKEIFSEKIEEIHDSLGIIETKVEDLTERVDAVEWKQEKTDDFVKNFKGILKWLGLSLAATLFSALASLIPIWVSQHPGTAVTSTISAPHAAHVKIDMGH